MTTTEEKLLFPDPVVTERFRVQAWGYTFLLVFLYLVNWADKALLWLVCTAARF